jgi:DNA-binding transcriptional LysR family regulator
MEIKQLEYVITAADMGSFNKASEYLYTTQSSVSKVIKSLEKELGYEIFRRQGSGVVLTDAGKALYEQSQQILQMLKKFETFSDFHKKTCFHIAAVASNFISAHFARFVKEVESENFCLKMYEGSISHVLDMVVQGEVELGFVYLGERQRNAFQTLMQRKGLYFKEMLPARMMVSVGPLNPYYDAKELEPKELQKMKFLRWSEDSLSRTYHLEQIEREFQLKKNMADAIVVSCDYALMNILKETERAYLSYGIIRNEIQCFLGDLKEIPIKYESEQICLGYIHREAEPISLAGKQFLRQIQCDKDIIHTTKGYSILE